MEKASVNEKETSEEELIESGRNALEQLELDMKKAVTDERYEDAARLRDEIKDLKSREE